MREHGIYVFPDGTQVVACIGENSRTILYYWDDWKLYGAATVEAESNAPAFRLLEANQMGQITRFSAPTRWHLDDLADTGQTAK